MPITNKYQRAQIIGGVKSGVSTPPWAGTSIVDSKVTVPGGGHLDATAFIASSTATRIRVAAAAASGATSITVSALEEGVPKNTILSFGVGKFARVTTDAASGTTSLTVEALPTALVVNDSAFYSSSDAKTVQSGTLVGRTYAERDGGIGYSPADVANDDEIHLLFHDVDDVNTVNECELYSSKAGNVVYENKLPGWESLPTAAKTWIRNNYVCITVP